MPKSEEEIIADAIAAGVDIKALEFNLTLSYDERARRHDLALARLLAKEAEDGGSKGTESSENQTG